MNKHDSRENFKRHVMASIAIGVLTLTAAPKDATAEFRVPNCKALVDLGLDYFNHYNDKRLTEVFGASIFSWRNTEIKEFVSGFKTCKQHFTPHQQFNFDVSVSMAANDIVRRINQHNKQQAKRKADVKVSQKVEALLKKYPNLKPKRGFLVTPFRTYAGATKTKEIASVIELYDQYRGEKRFEKVDDVWVIISGSVNAATGQKTTTRLVLKDLRPGKSYVWLDSVAIDGSILEPQVITYMVRQMFPN